MSSLMIEGLCASAGGQEILKGVDLEVRAGEVHAVMGPNGSGKSTLAHVVAGRNGYEVTSGSVRLDGLELVGLPSWRRAEAGLFLTMQYPIEVPGVSLHDMLISSTRTSDNPASVEERMREEAKKIGFDEQLLDRPVNVDMSGGERKRNEALQLGVLSPSFMVMDELDSGLDVDALRLVSQRIEEATVHESLGVLAITHYNRLFQQLTCDVVHIFAGGRVRASGGSELADIVEAEGYERWLTEEDKLSGSMASASDDPAFELFTDPFGDPFADRLV